MDNQISDEIKHQRINRLLDVLHQIGNDQNAWFKDQDVEVLVEGKSAHNPNKLSGRTKNGKLVNFSGDDQTIGTIIPVHIDRAKTFSLDGTAI